MARRTRTATPVPEADTATETVTNTFSPAEGGNAIAAAWQGLVNLFGATGTYTMTPEGFTFSDVAVNDSYDLNTIIDDIYRRGDKTVNPRLTFAEIYPLVSGETPAPFVNANQITAWMVKHMKGGSRSPKYAKEANQAYKEAHGFAAHRGRPRKIFHISDIGSLDEASLAGLKMEEVEKLRATLDSLAASQAQAVVTVE